MKKHEIDSEIKQKNYEKELLLCKKAGGDIEKYRRLSFDVLQLEQIRKGLESGIDVSSYLDPEKSWLEMEEIRKSLASGFDMSVYSQKGFDWLQCNEIRAGLQAKVDVTRYLNTALLAPQMKEIRKGLERGVDVSYYESPQFDWFQMREIRRGLEDKLDVSCYAKPFYKHATMRAIRMGLMEHIDLVGYAEKGYSGKVLTEIHRGLKLENDITGYLDRGYNAEQLKQINNAYEMGVNLAPYLQIVFHGVQLKEIIIGLKEKLDVSVYAKKEYNWFQMREIRYGLECGLDVTIYANPDFSARQMEVLRKGIMEGIDVSQYAKVYYEPEEMEEIRHRIQQEGTVLSEEMAEVLRNTLLGEAESEQEDTEEEGDRSRDFVLASCITVAEDQMSVVVDFSSIKDIMGEALEQLKVPDIIRLLKHQDIKQGIYRDHIKRMLDEKTFNEPVVVAEGKEPVDGEDGRFMFYFRKKLNRRPHVLEDGSVDYKNMELFECVKKEQLIAEYQQATQGMFGYDVKGQLLSPKRGKELLPLRGQGFVMTADRKKYYSLMDGIIELDELDGKLNIRNLYTVAGDVNAATGNINFNGDVNVMGNVEAGFTIVATGNIVIDGHCEGSCVSAGKDVIIRKGCQGQGVGEIIAGGDITGQFFESAHLSAKGDIEASYLLNCQLRTEGHLLVEGKKGVIIGGYTCAKKGITCYGLGNIAQIKTVLEVGIDKEDMAAYQELGKKIDKLDAEMRTCEAALNKLMEKPERNEKISAIVERLTKAVYTQKLQQKELLKQREDQVEKLTEQKGARIRVTGMAFPGTLLYMNAEPYSVKDTLSDIEFVKRENKVSTILR